VLGCMFAIGSGSSQLFGFRQLTRFFGALFNLTGDLIRDEIFDVAMQIILIVVIMISCYTLDSSCFGLASSRLTAKLRMHAYSAFVRQDIGFFDMEENSAGSLTVFLAEKVTLIEALTGGMAQATVRVVAALVTMIVLIFMWGPWQLALTLLGALPLVGAIMGVVTNTLMGDQIKAQQGKENATAKGKAEMDTGKMLSEVMFSIRTVAAFNAEQRFYDDYCKSVDRIYEMEKKQAFNVAIAMGVSMPAFIFLIAGLYYYMGYLIYVGACVKKLRKAFRSQSTPAKPVAGTGAASTNAADQPISAADLRPEGMTEEDAELARAEANLRAGRLPSLSPEEDDDAPKKKGGGGGSSKGGNGAAHEFDYVWQQLQSRIAPDGTAAAPPWQVQ